MTVSALFKLRKARGASAEHKKYSKKLDVSA